MKKQLKKKNANSSTAAAEVDEKEIILSTINL
jgi:hypothetical protein